MHRPELIIIAGPNGSGKTSVTQRFLHHEWAEGKIDFIIRAKEAGFFIRLFFISTCHPSINASRIQFRLTNGELAKMYVEDVQEWAQIILPE